MKNQNGSTLIMALILLTIITVVAAYTLESSGIQGKMVANSLFSTLTYQECRNEQEANVRQYNVNREALIESMVKGTPIQSKATMTAHIKVDTVTGEYATNAPKSTLDITWEYLREAPAARSGENLDSESQSKAYLFEHDCNAVLNFSKNSQTLGAIVEGLKQAGNLH